MKILSVGTFKRISDTCLHRNWALEKCSDEIDCIEMYPAKISFRYRLCNKLFNWGMPVRLPDSAGINETIKRSVDKKIYNIVWIDKGIIINKSTLEYIKNKQPNCKIVSFSPDNMVERHNQSQNYLNSLPLYDYNFTTKSYILDDLRNIGAKNIYFVNKTYEPKFHYPHELTHEEILKLGADVGFIGFWEQERCNSILFLVDNGIKVKVFGDGKWNEYKSYSSNLTILSSVYSEDYPKALRAFKISLCFLRKINKDQQTARTMEIPACGGFMLAERTEEHLKLFEEGKEAEFFGSNEELLKKCLFYLNHETQRKGIVANGLARCKTSGYSTTETIRALINIISSDI